jgi:hypothetical protein
MTKIAGTKESGFKTKRSVFFINNRKYFIIGTLSLYEDEDVEKGWK